MTRSPRTAPLCLCLAATALTCLVFGTLAQAQDQGGKHTSPPTRTARVATFLGQLVGGSCPTCELVSGTTTEAAKGHHALTPLQTVKVPSYFWVAEAPPQVTQLSVAEAHPPAPPVDSPCTSKTCGTHKCAAHACGSKTSEAKACTTGAHKCEAGDACRTKACTTKVSTKKSRCEKSCCEEQVFATQILEALPAPQFRAEPLFNPKARFTRFEEAQACPSCPSEGTKFCPHDAGADDVDQIADHILDEWAKPVEVGVPHPQKYKVSVRVKPNCQRGTNCAVHECPGHEGSEQTCPAEPLAALVPPHVPMHAPLAPPMVGRVHGGVAAWHPGIPGPHANLLPPPQFNSHQEVAELRQELSDEQLRSARFEATVEFSAAREEMMGELLDLKAENIRLQIEQNAREQLLEAAVENAKLKAQLELAQERLAVTEELAEARVEQIREVAELRAQLELREEYEGALSDAHQQIAHLQRELEQLQVALQNRQEPRTTFVAPYQEQGPRAAQAPQYPRPATYQNNPYADPPVNSHSEPAPPLPREE